MNTEDFIIKDDGYAAFMEETVEPFLVQRGTAHLIPRGGEGDLSCMRYETGEAKGVAVISHGFTETAEKYYEIVYYFLKQHYHVYIADHCGHGHSYRLVEDLSLVHVDRYERYVQDLVAVAELAKKEHPELPLFLYGHSMGGGVAAAALSVQPALFERAILSSPMIRPLTGNVPWGLAKFLAGLLCKTGKAKQYVPGGHPFDGNERFEDSASAGRERFEYYQKKRNEEPLYQMTSASCGWLHEAVKLNRYLMKTGWNQIRTPFLLFQSQNEAFVVNTQQDLFVEKVNSAGKTSAQKVFVPGTKHEIFNSEEQVVRGYWEQVFAFLSGEDGAGK